MADIRPIDANALQFKPGVLYDDQGFSVGNVALRQSDIDAAPTLDYAPVIHARWEKDKDDLFWGNHFIHQRCSLCGGEAHINRFGTAYILSAFCPNCGAKMDGGKKDGKNSDA